MKYQLKTFKNGLRLVTVALPVKSMTMEISVDAGSRYETEKNSGLSHFLEHLFFKGTKRRPTARTLATEVDSFGGIMNASTGKEETSFFIKAAAKHLPQALDILVDILTNSKFDPKEIEKERGVIIEEINMREDMPMARVGEIFDDLLYSPTPLGQKIIGKKENIRKMTRKDFLDYLKRFYQPERMVVVIAGSPTAISPPRRAFAHLAGVWGSGKAGRQRYTFSQTKPQIEIQYKKTEQAHFCLGVRAFRRVHPDQYVLAVLSTILGGSMSSRLFEELREKRGLAYYVKTEVECFQETGHLVTQAGTDINKIGEAIKVILEEYRRISHQSSIINHELKKAKEFLKGRLILNLEDSHIVAGLFGSTLLLEGKVRTPEEILAGIEKVTIADLRRVAQNIFLPKNLNLAIIGPYKKEDEKDFLSSL